LHVIVALHATGCRPSEIANLTAKEVKEDGGVIFFDLSEWKTEGKHAFRHIFLTEELEAVVRMLRHQHPSGPLFRNLRGNAWTRHSIAARFDDLRRMLDLPDTITAYSYRHTFATEWLRAGKSIKLLAQLLGNSVGTIEKHYAHLLDDKAAMQAALRDFRR
jgi:integrase